LKVGKGHGYKTPFAPDVAQGTSGLFSFGDIGGVFRKLDQFRSHGSRDNYFSTSGTTTDGVECVAGDVPGLGEVEQEVGVN
jgi:hypothetical protein